MKRKYKVAKFINGVFHEYIGAMISKKEAQILVDTHNKFNKNSQVTYKIEKVK